MKILWLPTQLLIKSLNSLIQLVSNDICSHFLRTINGKHSPLTIRLQVFFFNVTLSVILILSLENRDTINSCLHLQHRSHGSN